MHKHRTNFWHVGVWKLGGSNWTCQLDAWDRNDSVGRLGEPKTVPVIKRKLIVLKIVINFILTYVPFLYNPQWFIYFYINNLCFYLSSTKFSDGMTRNRTSLVSDSYSLLGVQWRLSTALILPVSYRGGFGGFKPPPPRNSEILTKFQKLRKFYYMKWNLLYQITAASRTSD
jgi:hypothetical protein